MRYNFRKGGITTRNRNTSALALCGLTAALAVSLGALGGMIPVATYVIPVLQCVILQLILTACGARFAWSWFGCVMLLNFLLCPDKEAAAMFLFLGYYPILKPRFDKLRCSVILKLLFFLASTGAMYGILIFVLGMEQIASEFHELGLALGVLCLILGGITFVLLDRILTRFQRLRP